MRKGSKHTEEVKERISQTLKGIVHSKETRIKLSKAMMGKNKGKKSHRFGSKNTEQSNQKNSENHKGEKNANWKGGKSFEPYSIDWTETLRRAIRERDNYICQLCSRYGNVVHHIDYIKENCNPNNLINLCRNCNTKINFNRRFWQEQFKILISLINRT